MYITFVSESYAESKKKISLFCNTSSTEIEENEKPRKRKKKQFFDSPSNNPGKKSKKLTIHCKYLPSMCDIHNLFLIIFK